MPVSKRTRYEVLKRDNHTCRYCHATDSPLTVDHVTPVALGGTGDPSNLVAACRDCNFGKASTSPAAALVEDVQQIDMQWANAIRRVAATRSRARKKSDRYVSEWRANWDEWTTSSGIKFPVDDSWEATIRRFYELGVPLEELKHCADVACGNNKVSFHDRFRYFAGCTWRVVTEMQDAAKALLTAEEVDGDA